VTRNPSATRSLLLSLRRRVPFRLEVPTLIDSSSQTDSVLPARAYHIARTFKAVRLASSIPYHAGAFWGIEPTNWPDAPVRTRRHFRHLAVTRRPAAAAGPDPDTERPMVTQFEKTRAFHGVDRKSRMAIREVSPVDMGRPSQFLQRQDIPLVFAPVHVPGPRQPNGRWRLCTACMSPAAA